MGEDPPRELIARIEDGLLNRHGAHRTANGGIEFACFEESKHKRGDKSASAWWSCAKLWWSCQGCHQQGGWVDACERLGIPMPAREARPPTIYAIRNLQGELIAEHRRDNLSGEYCERHHKRCTKHMTWWRNGAANLGGLRTADLPLYGIDTLLAAAELVVVTEGEKAREALVARDIAAVGTVTGSGGTPSDQVLRDLCPYPLVVLWPDADGVGREHMARIGERLTHLGIAWRVVDPWPERTDGEDAANWTESTDELEGLLASAAPPPPPSYPWLDMHTLQPRAVDWLWRDRIPYGFPTVLEGHPGLGKSVLTIDLAARASRGAAMPGEPPDTRTPQRVLFLSAEDSPDQVILPRLIAAGADLMLVKAFPLTALLGFPADLEEPQHAIVTIGARFVVIDPLSAFLTVNMNHDQEVRQALSPMTALFNRTNCALLFLRHFTKASDALAIHRGGGSIAITGAARSTLQVHRDPADEEMRILASAKNNLGTSTPVSLCFSTSARGDEAVVIVWHGDSEHTAPSLSRAESDAAKNADLRPDTVRAAVEWLRARLADGPVAVNQLSKDCRQSKVPWPTVSAASRTLRVVQRKEFSGAWVWELPQTH